MIRHIQKLELRHGDVRVVRDPETLHYLSMVKVPGIDGTIPLVFSPQGIQKLTRTDLLNLLEQLEQPSKASEIAPTEVSSAPL